MIRLFHSRLTNNKELEKLQNYSPQNFRDLLTCLSCLKRGFNFCSFPLQTTRSAGLILHVIPGSLEAQQSVDPFNHSDVAVPPIMEEVLDGRHVFISSGSD